MIKCCQCGKFISYDNIAKTEFTPDSEYTCEKIEYICIKCENRN